MSSELITITTAWPPVRPFHDRSVLRPAIECGARCRTQAAVGREADRDLGAAVQRERCRHGRGKGAKSTTAGQTAEAKQWCVRAACTRLPGRATSRRAVPRRT